MSPPLRARPTRVPEAVPGNPIAPLRVADHVPSLIDGVLQPRSTHGFDLPIIDPASETVVSYLREADAVCTHLLFLVGLRNKIAVFGQWVYHYFTYKRGARIIINLKD